MHFINKLAISSLAALALAGCATATAQGGQGPIWVAGWTASPHAPLGAGGPFGAASFEDVTISQVLRLSEGGERARVRFTNRYGERPLEIGEARIFLIDANNAEIAGTSRALTFDGAAGAVIPRGAPFLSDPVDIAIPDLARLKVEFYLPGQTGPCTCHLTGVDELAVSPSGNHVGREWVPETTAQYRAFLHTVEVESADALGTIVTYGDSITDGVGATAGENRRWPDILANRLQQAGLEWAVANAAISGNRVLSPGMGESALARFDEDVLSLPNVEYLIVFEGVNDLGNRYGPQSSQGGAGGLTLDQPQIDVPQMIAGFRQLIDRAHARGIKVIGSPIGPYKGASYWTEEGEAARRQINDWIVNSGEFDGVVRLDTAFADPADSQAMREGYHIGDFLHGSDAGLRAVGESIPLTLFAAE